MATWLKHLWAQSMHTLASCARFVCMRARNITFQPIELQTSLMSLDRGFLGCWILLNQFQKPNVHLCTFINNWLRSTIDWDHQLTEIDNRLRLTIDWDWQSTEIDNRPRLTIDWESFDRCSIQSAVLVGMTWSTLSFDWCSFQSAMVAGWHGPHYYSILHKTSFTTSHAKSFTIIQATTHTTINRSTIIIFWFRDF